MSDESDAGKTPPTEPASERIDKLLFLREIEEFLIHEGVLLDEGRFEEWRDLFTDDGYYWAPASINQQSPKSEVSLFYDDKQLMTMRIERLQQQAHGHGQAPASRTSHQISNIVIKEADHANGSYVVHSRFVVVDYRPEMDQQVFSGLYEHRLLRDGDSFKIATKKATTINCDSVFYPLSMPF